jgi:outer membrane lipoprotein
MSLDIFISKYLMKKLLPAILLIIMLISCAPILSQDTMKRGAFNVPLSALKKDPGFYKGWLFIIGGIIINTEVTEKSSVIEAIRVPVDSRGHLESIETTTGRYLAIYPEDKGLLEPIIFRKDRKMTLAGKFTGLQTMKINEVERIYPVFEIKELYLWRQWKMDSSGQPIIELERQWKMDYKTSQSFHITSDNDDKTITEIPDKSSVFNRKLHEKQPAVVIEEVQTRDTDMHELTDSEQQQISKTEAVEVMHESNKLQEKEQTVNQKQSITESAISKVVDEKQTDKLTPQEPANSGQIKEVTEKLKVKVEVSDLKTSLTKEVTTASIEYYVQVGTWKNSKYAEDMLVKIKQNYAEAYIVEHNNFIKIRIPGVLTKIQGTIISKDIEDKFNLKPLVVQKIQ